MQDVVKGQQSADLLFGNCANIVGKNCETAYMMFLGTGQRGYLQYHNLPGVSSEYQRLFYPPTLCDFNPVTTAISVALPPPNPSYTTHLSSAFIFYFDLLTPPQPYKERDQDLHSPHHKDNY